MMPCRRAQPSSTTSGTTPRRATWSLAGLGDQWATGITTQSRFLKLPHSLDEADGMETENSGGLPDGPFVDDGRIAHPARQALHSFEFLSGAQRLGRRLASAGI